jgi:hypothetical protein
VRSWAARSTRLAVASCRGRTDAALPADRPDAQPGDGRRVRRRVASRAAADGEPRAVRGDQAAREGPAQRDLAVRGPLPALLVPRPRRRRQVGGDAHASERLDRHRAWAEKQTRAVSTSTLSFVSGVVLPPWVAEAVSFGVRSTAPLADALQRIDLPPEGDSASWAKTTTGATVAAGSQSAENAAVTASTDPVIGSVEDNLKTLSA